MAEAIFCLAFTIARAALLFSWVRGVEATYLPPSASPYRWAILSAMGANSLAHIGSVSASSWVRGGRRRQCPSSVSTNSAFQNVRRCSRSRPKLSILGRTDSMRSRAKEGRLLVFSVYEAKPGVQADDLAREDGLDLE